MHITHGSLFTGRGGFEAAAETLGIKTIWNCELDPWLRGKLRGLYPNTYQYTNVKNVNNATPPILSARVSRVRTYRKRIRMRRVLRAARAAFGLRRPELLASVSPITLFSKTQVNYLHEVSSTCYKTYPASGMMRSGIVLGLSTLGGRIKDAGYTLLPTPVASDYDAQFSCREKLLAYLAAGHQRRLIYECQLVGLTRSEILSLYREMMGFKITEERSRPTGTQLCLL